MASTKAQRIGDPNNLMSMSEYLFNKEKRNEFTFCIFPSGRTCFMKKGVEFSLSEIDIIYPIPSSLLLRKNCDTSFIY
jgi:hypothetical protein